MIGGRVARHTAVIIHAPLVDDGRGNKSRDWANATETSSPGWAVDAASTDEDRVNRDGASVEYIIRGPYGAEVVKDDRVRLMGGLYRIEGAVLRQPGPSAATSHTVLRLVSWEG